MPWLDGLVLIVSRFPLQLFPQQFLSSLVVSFPARCPFCTIQRRITRIARFRVCSCLICRTRRVRPGSRHFHVSCAVKNAVSGYRSEQGRLQTDDDAQGGVALGFKSFPAVTPWSTARQGKWRKHSATKGAHRTVGYPSGKREMLLM